MVGNMTLIRVIFAYLRFIFVSVFSLMLFAALTAQEEEEGECSLSYIERSSPNLIHNCVCVVTGAYVDSVTDLVVPGLQP